MARESESKRAQKNCVNIKMESNSNGSSSSRFPYTILWPAVNGENIFK